MFRIRASLAFPRTKTAASDIKTFHGFFVLRGQGRGNKDKILNGNEISRGEKIIACRISTLKTQCLKLEY